MRHHPRRRDCGLSVVEVAVSAGILSVVFVVAAGSVSRVHGFWRGTAARNDLDRRGAATTSRIGAVFDGISASSVTSVPTKPAGASTLTFKCREGWSAGADTWGPVTTVKWESEPSDPENGQDDDKDGLVDEGVVVMETVKSSVTTRTILVTGVANRLEGETVDTADNNGNGLVDERGFSLEQDGTRLIVRLTLLRRGPDGAVARETSKTSVPMGK